MQTAQSNHCGAKRLGASAVAVVMLLGAVVPAYATVSQLPGLYMTPPDANVMYTLDDSLSMLSDVIPDVDPTNQKESDAVKMPNSDGKDSNSDALSGSVLNVNAQFPGMWKKNTAYWATTHYQLVNRYGRFFRSKAGNPLYYDPAVTYTPWPQATSDKQVYSQADVAKVNISQNDPFDTTFTRDLTTRVNAFGTAKDPDKDSNNFWPATYFVYKGTAAMQAGNPNDANNVPSNFTKVEIKTSALTPTFARPTKILSDGTLVANDSRTDCGSNTTLTCSFAVEQQNFANWLQYYRSRMLMAKGGVAAAFAEQGTNLRIGYGTINTSGTVVQGVAAFAGTRRQSFYAALYGSAPSGGGTQLRRAMDDVGKYFQRSNAGNPWALDPTSSTLFGTEYTCRRSFHVLSTDGYWNGSGATGDAAKDNDAFSGSTPMKPDGTAYVYGYSGPKSNDPLVDKFAQDPFRDGTGDTLADVAAYYWKSDLRTDLANDVPSSRSDPAFWQHLVTYTIGLGVSGTGNVSRVSDGSKTVPNNEPGLLTYQGKGWLSTQDLRNYLVTNRVAMTWTKPTADSAQTGDDLIHASMNGRGKYFSASDPTTLKVNLAQTLSEAGDNPGSLANVVTQSAQVSAGSAAYQATYNPAQWSGRFYAFPQAADGSVNSAPSNALWEASNRMPAPANRNIFTWNPTTKLGTSFLWANLTATQRSNLGTSSVLDFLRGSNADEASTSGGTRLLRDRARYTVDGVTGGVLGDVVNGSPIEGPSDGAGYDRLPSGTPGQGTYAAYRSSSSTMLDNMRNTLFLGANDGMLHAFDRTNGVERFAFIPDSVYSVPRSPSGTELKLQTLSDPAYAHRFLMDGPLQIADAFLGPDAASATWRTVLVGSTGAGARSVFAIDVSNPVVGAGMFGTSSLLWEFSESNNSDMGYVTGYVNVARMRDGTWVGIFGNGLDSMNGQAKLFIVDLRTGAIVWQQAVGAAGGNGLSQPNFTLNSNREVTGIYAGDLKGNVWKFDVDNADKTKWKVAFGSAPNYLPLFAGSATQPITVMPELTFHTSGGVMLTFGTGKLLETEDTNSIAPPTPGANVNLNQQAIYGVWDKPGASGFALTENLLVQQGANTLLAAAADSKANLSGTTTEPIDWTTKRGWYLNLESGGERVNVNPEQINKVLLLVTNKPDADPCKSGGKSRLFVLDPITGGAPNFAVFDSNGDGGMTATDKGYNVKNFTFGVLSLPAVQSKKSGADAVTSERAGSRGQTGARLGGVELGRGVSTDCVRWLLAGGSNASIAGLDITTCTPGTPRVSWRQLK